MMEPKVIELHVKPNRFFRRRPAPGDERVALGDRTKTTTKLNKKKNKNKNKRQTKRAPEAVADWMIRVVPDANGLCVFVLTSRNGRFC